MFIDSANINLSFLQVFFRLGWLENNISYAKKAVIVIPKEVVDLVKPLNCCIFSRVIGL